MAFQERDMGKTLYVGNLPHEVTEGLLLEIFGSIGARCTSCKIKRETVDSDDPNLVKNGSAESDPYAFIDFQTPADAAFALASMNNVHMMGKDMKVNWASPGGNQQKQDTSKHYHIFVGDLGQDIETHHLLEAFSPFGEVSDVKIIKDPQSQKSKGYGFVSFIQKIHAEKAIANMNGQWIGSRAIRTNWATRKPPAPNQKEAFTPKQYEEVYSQSSMSNNTVYVGGFDKATDLAEGLIHKLFQDYGTIKEVRIFKDKGYAFVRFEDHSQATRAICGMHGKEIGEGNTPLKCSWGRESGDPNNTVSQQTQQVGNAHESAHNASSNHQQFNTNQAQYSAAYYGVNAYWPFTQAGQYQQMQQTAAGYMQPGVTSQYYNYPTMTYNPASLNVAAMTGYGQMQMQPGQAGQQYSGQQASMMAGYPMQQDKAYNGYDYTYQNYYKSLDKACNGYDYQNYYKSSGGGGRSDYGVDQGLSGDTW